jgi:hypothetical protein
VREESGWWEIRQRGVYAGGDGGGKSGGSGGVRNTPAATGEAWREWGRSKVRGVGNGRRERVTCQRDQFGGKRGNSENFVTCQMLYMKTFNVL